MVEAPSRIRMDNVEDLVARMRKAVTEESTALGLDLSQVESITRSAGAFLCSALLTDLDGVALDLLPPSRLPVDKILASSLGFALAHRSGDVTVREISAATLNLDRWRLPYTPARQLLPFDEYQLEEPEFVVEKQASFVNPHQTARRGRRTDVPLRVQSWLHSVLPPRAREPKFLQDLHDLTFELVDNVAEHADAVGRNAKSIVQVSVARGKSADVRDRVWVLVMDTGPGMLATAAPKLAGVPETELNVSQQRELALSLFAAGHSPIGRARGLGLPRVERICQRWKNAKLEAFTGFWRILLEGEKKEANRHDLILNGTLVVARFTTPPESVSTPTD